MPKKASKLSITKRVLLDYIKFRTHNNFKFYEGNEYIAQALELTPGSAKVFVNDLIRDGYLYKETDKQGRRVLSYTGKEYMPLFEDMRNVDKKVLKQEKEDLKRDNDYLNQELETHKTYADRLRTERTELVLSNTELTIKVRELEERIQKLEEQVSKQSSRINDLENLFYKNGVSEQDLEKAINESKKDWGFSPLF